jgi:phage terminase large subunit-like protein
MAKKKHPVNHGVIFSCTDWNERLNRLEYPLDVKKYLPYMNAERMGKCIDIISRFRIPDLPGQPLRSEPGYFPDWQRNTFSLIAGGLQSNGEQLIKTALICVPKKSDKSSGSASLMLALLMMSPRPNADMILCGPTQEISQISFKQVVGIIQADKDLAKLFHIQMHLKKVTFIPNRCTLSIRTFDSNVLTGTKASVCLIDETHLLDTEEHSRIAMQIKGAGASVREQQTILITTMSDKVASGFWKQELTLARAVRNGESEVEGYLPLIWEPDPKDMDDIAKVCRPEVWERCNPNLGRSVSMAWLKQSFKAVLATNDDAELKRWLSQHSNVPISQFATSLENQWPGAGPWMKRGDPSVTLDWIRRHCGRIAFGFDGGGAHDLTSLAVMGIDSRGHVYVVTKSWLFEEAMAQDFTAKGALSDAVRDGDLKVIIPGEEVNEIVDLIVDSYNENPSGLIGVGLDPASIAAELADRLEDVGIPKNKVIGIKQGYGLVSGWKALYRRCSNGSLTHGDQMILNWAVSNARQDAQGLVTKKLVSSAYKIDPAVACATAMVLCLNPPQEFDVAAMISGAETSSNGGTWGQMYPGY